MLLRKYGLLTKAYLLAGYSLNCRIFLSSRYFLFLICFLTDKALLEEALVSSVMASDDGVADWSSLLLSMFTKKVDVLVSLVFRHSSRRSMRY